MFAWWGDAVVETVSAFYPHAARGIESIHISPIHVRDVSCRLSQTPGRRGQNPKRPSSPTKPQSCA